MFVHPVPASHPLMLGHVCNLITRSYAKVGLLTAFVPKLSVRRNAVPLSAGRLSTSALVDWAEVVVGILDQSEEHWCYGTGTAQAVQHSWGHSDRA